MPIPFRPEARDAREARLRCQLAAHVRFMLDALEAGRHLALLAIVVEHEVA